MKIVKMETHMLSQKVIANVTPEFARVYKYTGRTYECRIFLGR